MSFPLLPLVGAIAQSRAGPSSTWALPPLLPGLGFPAAGIAEAKVSQNASGRFLFFVFTYSFMERKRDF